MRKPLAVLVVVLCALVGWLWLPDLLSRPHAEAPGDAASPPHPPAAAKDGAAPAGGDVGGSGPTEADVDAAHRVEASVPAPPAAPAPTTLRLLLRDPRGAPVAGVPWALVPTIAAADRAVKSVVSDVDGICDFGEVEPGTWRAVPQPGRVQVLAGAANERVVVLAETLRVRGRVVDEGGAAVADAAVRLSLDRQRPLLAREVARSDAEGVFAFAAPGVVDAFVAASKPGRVPSVQEVLRSSENGAEVEITLRVGGIAAGLDLLCLDAGGRPCAGVFARVVDAAAGHPPPTGGRTVAMSLVAPAPIDVGPSGADGILAVEGLAAGPAQLVAWLDDGPSALATVEIPTGPARAFARLELAAGGRVSGTVRDEDGTALAAARLATGDGPALRTARSDAAGAYAFAALPPGPRELRVAVDGRPEVRTRVVVPAVGEQRHDVVVPRGVDVRARIVTAEGLPVARSRVVWRTAGAALATADTDDAGDFAFTGLADARFVLSVTPRGQQPQELLRGDSPRDLPAELRLPVQAATDAAIRGVVCDDAFRPLPGVRVLVYAQSTGEPGGTSLTGEDGTFAVRRLAAGTWTVMVRADERPTTHRAGIVLPSGAEVDVGNVVVPAPVPLSIALDLPDGVETGAAWRAMIFDEQDVARAGQVLGAVVAPPPLGPGRYRVQVTGPGVATSVQPFELFAGAPAEVRVVVEPGVRVTLAIADPSGALGSWLELVELDEHGATLAREVLLASLLARGDPLWLRPATRRIRARPLGAATFAEVEVAPGAASLAVLLPPTDGR